MPKVISRKRRIKECVTLGTRIDMAPSRWQILPPEIIYIIIELLKDDRATLRACSLAAREFSRVALSHIGRHITVNRAARIKQCAQLLTTNSALQHVRSLDLGVTSKSSNSEDYLGEQLITLEIFAQRQTLTRLWLSKFPFTSIKSSQRVKMQAIITALSSTINDLGLYECRFPSYTGMISFIRAFPHCDSLYIRDCVADDRNLAENILSGLPEHKLSLSILELSSASSNGSIIDVSSLIQDAGLGVSRLSSLTCSVGPAEQARSVAVATSASPIQHFQLVCTEPGGFQAFLNPVGEKWALESLTIGPLSHRTDREFWHDAFQNFPTVPHMRELTILYYYQNAKAFDMSCWVYFNSHFCRMDIFPQSMQVDIRMAIGSRPLSYAQERAFTRTFSSLRRSRSVTFWGRRSYYWH